MRCNVCGADNLEGSAYCEDCGARLPTGSAPAAAPVPAPPPVTAPPVAAPVTQEQPAPSMPPAPVEMPPVEMPPVAAAAPEPVASSASVIICPACGANNLPGVAFCEDCGASLSDAPVTAAAAAAPPVNYDATPHPVHPVASPPSPVAVAARSRLVLTNGKGEFPLEKDTILMGRRSPVDGIFPEIDLTDHDTDSYISRRHGRITRQDSGFVYEDLGSSNGSWVNGSKMQPHVQQPLREGDGLRLGKTEFVVRLS